MDSMEKTAGESSRKALQGGYRQGKQPRRYGCRDYSLEMQLLQLRRRQVEAGDKSGPEYEQRERRIREIEELLGM